MQTNSNNVFMNIFIFNVYLYSMICTMLTIAITYEIDEFQIVTLQVPVYAIR